MKTIAKVFLILYILHFDITAARALGQSCQLESFRIVHVSRYKFGVCGVGGSGRKS